MNKFLENAYYNACMAEIQALKPGNVHMFADGHGMTVQDFITSAAVTAPIICAANLSLGERILQSVQATQQAVNCNTNLGIILLCAPLSQTLLLMPCDSHGICLSGQSNFIDTLKKTLNKTTVQDADHCFKAIALANPAGLGDSAQHNVHQPADCTLLQAMQFGAARDLIAKQYAQIFVDVIETGVPTYTQAIANGCNAAWSTTLLYLTLLARFDDSHVLRKNGLPIATQLRADANVHLKAFLRCDNPKLYQKKLLDWDKLLKENHINPGTCADMTVATMLLVSSFTHLPLE